MRRSLYLTTSWDDGHPLDLRVAALLDKYRLTGTFYVPRSAPTGTMGPADVRELAGSFEVGAHTLDHVFLPEVDPPRARSEIVDSKAWVESVTGQPCNMFCPPLGRYGAQHLSICQEAGYLGMRTVEFLSLDRPRRHASLRIRPTTIHAYPHHAAAYVRNLAKRAALRNLWLLLLHGPCRQWINLARSLLRHAAQTGGVFHLWGHSWELESLQQWERLELLLREMTQLTSDAPCLTNGQICRQLAS